MTEKEIKEAVKYWQETSDQKWRTAQSLLKSKHYSDALFFCHLALEAELKSIFVSKNKVPAPFIHDLLKLAQSSDVSFIQIKKDELEEINTFNIRARYDDYKNAFYKKATIGYAQKYYKITQEIKLWLRKN